MDFFCDGQIVELRDDINYHNKFYNDEDKNTISDYEYDQKMNALVDLEKKFPELKSKNSPSIKVGGKITKEFETFKHSNPMLSLSNTYSEKDLNIIKRIKYLLKEKGLTINGVKKLLKNKDTNLLDDSVSLGVYKSDFDKPKNIKDSIKKIAKIVKQLKELK